MLGDCKDLIQLKATSLKILSVKKNNEYIKCIQQNWTVNFHDEICTVHSFITDISCEFREALYKDLIWHITIVNWRAVSQIPDGDTEAGNFQDSCFKSPVKKTQSAAFLWVLLDIYYAEC